MSPLLQHFIIDLENSGGLSNPNIHERTLLRRLIIHLIDKRGSTFRRFTLNGCTLEAISDIAKSYAARGHRKCVIDRTLVGGTSHILAATLMRRINSHTAYLPMSD